MTERDLILRAWNTFLAEYPIIVTPVYCEPSMRVGQDEEGPDALHHLFETARYLLALPALGLPGLAVPVGFHHEQPQGVQIISRRFREDLCFDAGEAIEMREGRQGPIDPRW